MMLVYEECNVILKTPKPQHLFSLSYGHASHLGIYFGIYGTGIRAVIFKMFADLSELMDC